MRTATAAMALALVGFVPAVGAECGHDAAASAAATPPSQLAATPAPAASVAPTTAPLKAPAPKTATKQDAEKIKVSAPDAKVTVASNK